MGVNNSKHSWRVEVGSLRRESPRSHPGQGSVPARGLWAFDTVCLLPVVFSIKWPCCLGTGVSSGEGGLRATPVSEESRAWQEEADLPSSTSPGKGNGRLRAGAQLLHGSRCQRGRGSVETTHFSHFCNFPCLRWVVSPLVAFHILTSMNWQTSVLSGESLSG